MLVESSSVQEYLDQMHEYTTIAAIQASHPENPGCLSAHPALLPQSPAFPQTNLWQALSHELARLHHEHGQAQQHGMRMFAQDMSWV